MEKLVMIFGPDMKAYMAMYLTIAIFMFVELVANIYWADGIFSFIDLTIATILGICGAAILFTTTYLWNIPLIVKIIYLVGSLVLGFYEFIVPVGCDYFYYGLPEDYYPGRFILVSMLWPAFLMIRLFRELKYRIGR